MREGRRVSLIECLKQGSELKSSLSIGKLFQRFMTRSVKKVGSNRAIAKIFKNLIKVASKLTRILDRRSSSQISVRYVRPF